MDKRKDKINFGFIGLGQQAIGLLFRFIDMDDVRVVAGCDVYDCKRERFAKEVREHYQEKGEKKVKVDLYEDYQDLLARPDIDAVVIATPDHQHAVIAIAACKAGKDIYLEKPMTLTIYEGQQLCKAVRKYNRILQVGSMQRSSDEFIHATSIVREGTLGKIDRIKVYVGRFEDTPFPLPMTLPKQEVPAGLNWDKWLGPLPTSVYFSETLDPYATDEKNEGYWAQWRYFKTTGGGLMTDWGAHMFDIAQWAIGKDNYGPVEVIPPGYKYYDHLTYKYDNGIVMTEEKLEDNGVKIYGENGWIQVSRGHFKASDPELEKFNVPEHLNHYESFIEAIKTRVDPNCPVEVGHSSCTVCTLGNLAYDLGRPLTWNPIVQKFMHDEEANKRMHYTYRDGYSLDV